MPYGAESIVVVIGAALPIGVCNGNPKLRTKGWQAVQARESQMVGRTHDDRDLSRKREGESAALRRASSAELFP
jgi:hypothetical protein